MSQTLSQKNCKILKKFTRAGFRISENWADLIKDLWVPDVADT